MMREDGYPEPRRIMLIGQSGSAKSATGNTILQCRAFEPMFTSSPLEWQAERGEFEGTSVSVVNTLFDLTSNSTKTSKCISYCAPGPHAFLLVMPLKRFTDVDRHLKILQRLFGVEASRYTIVLFTHEGGLADGVTAEQFIRQNTIPYGVGYHFFNNRDENPSQVRELLEKINTMLQRNGGSYNINVKDWKQKYLYPIASAVTIGCSIGAASGGTTEGVLVATVGSALGSVAAGVVGTKAVVLAAIGVVPGAVAGGGLTGVISFGFIAIAVGAFLYFIVCGAAVDVAGYEACVVGAVFGSHAAYMAVAIATDGAAMGLRDAFGTGIVIGARIAAKAAAAIFAGADIAGAAGCDAAVLHDIVDKALWAGAMFGVYGGAVVGAGVSAAVRVYADGPILDLIAHGCAVYIGVSSILGSLLCIIPEAAGTKNKIVGLAIVVGMSAGAAFGAAVGVLSESGFSAGVIIIIVCKAVVMWLNRSS